MPFFLSTRSLVIDDVAFIKIPWLLHMEPKLLCSMHTYMYIKLLLFLSLYIYSTGLPTNGDTPDLVEAPLVIIGGGYVRVLSYTCMGYPML